MRNIIDLLLADEGQDIAEYAVMLAVILVLVVGTIRLVGGMTVSIYVFPTLLKEFQRLHSDVDVKVMTGPADRLVSA